MPRLTDPHIRPTTVFLSEKPQVPEGLQLSLRWTPLLPACSGGPSLRTLARRCVCMSGLHPSRLTSQALHDALGRNHGFLVSSNLVGYLKSKEMLDFTWFSVSSNRVGYLKITKILDFPMFFTEFREMLFSLRHKQPRASWLA